MIRRSMGWCALASLLLPSVLACSATATNEVPADGGPSKTADDASTDAGTDATSAPDTGTNRHVPVIHRPTANTCPLSAPGRPTGQLPDAGPLTTDGTCTDDSQCGVFNAWDGHCDLYPDAGAKECNYDQCFVDSDCGSDGGVCSCEGETFGEAHTSPGNMCVYGNCRVDSDCGSGGYCSPTYSEGCGAFYGVQGWYCHTQQDECVDAVDCGNDGGASPYAPPFCVYESEIGHWACSTSVCAG